MVIALRRWGPLVAGVLLCFLLFMLAGGGEKARADASGEQTGGSQDVAGDLTEESAVPR